jgi:hypothetical protein
MQHSGRLPAWLFFKRAESEIDGGKTSPAEASVSYAQFEKMKRQWAKQAGVAGAILGAVVSVVGIWLVWIQYAQHTQFERLADSSVVQQQLKIVQAPGEVNPDPYAQQEKSNELSLQPEKESGSQSPPSNGVVLSLGEDDSPSTEVNSGGIKVIHWTRDYGVESLELEDGRWIHPTPAPPPWAYLLILLSPVAGFFIPWICVRTFAGEQTLFSHRHAEGQDPNAR